MRRAAFFDIDGTLVRCQTQQRLAKMMRKEKLLPFFQTVKIFIWFFIYKAGWAAASTDFRRNAYQVLFRYPKERIDAVFSKTTREIIDTELRQEMKNFIHRHRQAGELVFAVSGSLFELCFPVCQEFEIDQCFSTRLCIVKGRYTGQWEGNILEGSHKVKLMEELARRYGFELSECTAYADSYSDLPMLESVGRPVAVWPDDRLKKHAIRENWKIFEGEGGA